jgi:GNAT superfamily N-acetyltransferase
MPRHGLCRRMTGSTADALFDAALLRRAPQLTVEPETAAHRSFLAELFAACSPLSAVLPPAMMDMQFATQDASFSSDHPAAMRRIVCWNWQPVGRIVVAWDAPGSILGVDIAVHPDGRASGAGLAMLRAWVDVADVLGRRCTLNVVATNPAQRIYQRLGFRAVGAVDPEAAYIAMERPHSA